MSLGAARASRAIDPALERRQREYEFARALEAARTFQARLEMLADHPFEVRVVRELRDRLASELAALATLEEEARDGSR